jgi:hypothetical protein
MSFNLNSEYPTKGRVCRLKNIRTVKYAADLVLVAKEETVLQGMIVTLTGIGRRYGMEINVENTKLTRIPRQPSSIQIMIRSQNNWIMWNISTMWTAKQMMQ